MNKENFIQIENQLIYRIDKKEEYNTQDIRELMRGSIQGVAILKGMKDERGKAFAYDTSNKIKLSEYLIKPNVNKVMNFFHQFIQTISDASEKDFNIKYFVLDSEYIYVDLNNEEISLIGVPITNLNINSISVKGFLKTLLINLKLSDDENLEYIGRLIAYLNKEDFNNIGFLNKIKEIMKDYNISEFVRIDLEDALFETVDDIMDSQPVTKIAKPNIQKTVETSINDNEGIQNSVNNDVKQEEKVIEDILNSSDTGQDKLKTAYLQRAINGEKIYIVKDKMLIGKGKDEDVDYTIVTNGAISRKHLWIEKKGQDYFVTDNNSSNGTYLNKVKLAPNTEEYITSGSVLHLADEDFVFVIPK